MFKNKYFIAAVLAVLVIGVGFGAHAFGIDATMGAAQLGALALIMLVPTGTSLAGYACDDALSQLATEFKSQTSEVKGKMGGGR